MAHFTIAFIALSEFDVRFQAKIFNLLFLLVTTYNSSKLNEDNDGMCHTRMVLNFDKLSLLFIVCSTLTISKVPSIPTFYQ